MDAKEVHLEVTKKVGTKDYPNPARTGVAYMIAPVMRGWTARPEPVDHEYASLYVLCSGRHGRRHRRQAF